MNIIARVALTRSIITDTIMKPMSIIMSIR